MAELGNPKNTIEVLNKFITHSLYLLLKLIYHLLNN